MKKKKEYLQLLIMFRCNYIIDFLARGEKYAAFERKHSITVQLKKQTIE